MHGTTVKLLARAAASVSLAVMASLAPAMAQEEFSEALVLVEINATDGDVGFHALLDGDPWRWARIDDPDGRRLFSAKAKGPLRDQGLTENFFESAEPVCLPEDAEEDDEPVVTLAEFLARFPEGEYDFRGRTLDGEALRSTAELTYDLPAAPDIDLTDEVAFPFDPMMPELTPVILMWEPGDDLGEKCHDQALVDMGLISDPAGVEVVLWEAVLEPADDEVLDPERKVAVQLRGDQDSFTVPPEYLASLWDDAAEDGVLWVKFEVGAREASGNQTFSEGEFCLYAEDEEDCEEDEEG